MTDFILTLNAGSSSIKFSLFDGGGSEPKVRAVGEIEGLGGGGPARMKVKGVDGVAPVARALDRDKARNHAAGITTILHFLKEAFPDAEIVAVGHRVVHGGPHNDQPIAIDDVNLAELAKLEPLAPLHQPHNLAGIRAARAAFPHAPQVACFDTAFHRGHPFADDAYALPRALYDEGVRRYGFHGLSYDYVSRHLAKIDPQAAAGRVIACHLGNGASMCAMLAGKSMASTMGFSTLDGVPMGTRTGQIDPGVLIYLMQAHGLTADALTDLLYKQSGLKGLSGLSNDMRDLEASDDPRAAQAIDYFVHRILIEVGGMTAGLGGLDALVFTAGIGENSPRVRGAVMDGLGWLGLNGDAAKNAANATLISAAESRIKVFVVRTNEELRIAELTSGFLPRR